MAGPPAPLKGGRIKGVRGLKKRTDNENMLNLLTK
jgi:hypothetical protein